MDKKLLMRETSKISNQCLICQKHSDETFFTRKICVIKSDKLDLTNLHKRLPNQPLMFANFIPMFTISQHFYSLGEEKRRIERMMSRFFIWFPNWLVY